MGTATVPFAVNKVAMFGIWCELLRSRDAEPKNQVRMNLPSVSYHHMSWKRGVKSRRRSCFEILAPAARLAHPEADEKADAALVPVRDVDPDAGPQWLLARAQPFAEKPATRGCVIPSDPLQLFLFQKVVSESHLKRAKRNSGASTFAAVEPVPRFSLPRSKVRQRAVYGGDKYMLSLNKSPISTNRTIFTAENVQALKTNRVTSSTALWGRLDSTSSAEQQTVKNEQAIVNKAPSQSKEKAFTPKLDDGGVGGGPGGGDDGGGGGGGGGWGGGGFVFWALLLFIAFLRDRETEKPYNVKKPRRRAMN